MPVFVEVAVNIPGIAGSFHYHLPPELQGRVQAGSLVTVPFSTQRAQGVVVRLLDHTDVPSTRPVEALVDEQPVLTPMQLELATWLSRQTLSPLSTCLDAMIPPGLSQHVDLLVTPRGLSMPIARETSSALEARLVKLLAERGPLRGRQIEVALPRQNWRNAVKVMQKQGVVEVTSILPAPTAHPKTIRTVQLIIPAEEIANHVGSLGKQKAVIERRLAVLRYLSHESWPVELAWVYAVSRANLADLQKLEELGLVFLSESEVWRDPLKEIAIPTGEIPVLTTEQSQAWEMISRELSNLFAGEPGKPVLLNGVTGSGKTEIYLRAIQAVIEKGQQSLYLVPEISLTPQTIRRLLGRFPGRVGVIHSRLSPGERYDTWRRARAGLLSVIIGPRSALFSPLPALKLIVVDECHEESYYQSDSPPNYHAATTAVAYGKIAGAMVLLGSATPGITQSYQAQVGEWQELRLPHRIQPGKTPGSQAKPEGELARVELIDMRDELKSGNRSIFSRSLSGALESVLATGQQAILFLNRRGTATHVFCRNCGRSIQCPRCDKPLTQHGSLGQLICHTCGYRRGQPHTCPQCGSGQIQGLGIGTERVEKEVQKLFPSARTLRWDLDTTREKGAHEVILAHFSQHRADILIGTQMLAKGLDLPLVTLVGVILADISLNLPDYRATERTFQLLTQVSGRAGRSPLGGKVVLQSYRPEHYAIQAASRQDQAGFYQQELEYRRQLRYPPFSRLMRLEFHHTKNEEAEKMALRMADELLAWIHQEDRKATDLVGPAPCFFSRQNSLFRWQIIVRGPRPEEYFKDRPIPPNCRVELDPPNLL